MLLREYEIENNQSHCLVNIIGSSKHVDEIKLRSVYIPMYNVVILKELDEYFTNNTNGSFNDSMNL